jgi:hypothetical protein
MALKVKAVERKIKFNKNDKGVYRYMMQPELYIALTQASDDVGHFYLHDLCELLILPLIIRC